MGGRYRIKPTKIKEFWITCDNCNKDITKFEYNQGKGLCKECRGQKNQ